MHFRLSLALSAMVLAQTAPLAAKDPLVLAPSSRWNLDYADEACRLGRSFGEGGNEVILVLAKYAPGYDIEVMASGTGLTPDRARSFSYSFDPLEKKEVDRPLFGDMETGGTIWQFNAGLIPQDALEALAKAGATAAQVKAVETRFAKQAESVTLKIGNKAPVTLRTGHLDKGLAAMDECLDNLVTSWGYDPAEIAEIVTWPQPVGRITSWFNSRDYPDEALRKNLSGKVRFRLGIDEAGAIETCTIQAAYSDPAFAETVCNEFARKGKFTPATNADGQAVKSYWTNAVVFLSQP